MRLSILDQEDGDVHKRELAQLLSEGASHKDIAKAFGVHHDTIGAWKKRQDIRALVSAFITERANNILSHTDTAILKRLEASGRGEGNAIPTETLLKIRQTFAGEKVQLDVKGNASEAMEEFLLKLHEDPELAAAFGQAVGDGDSD